MQFCVVKNTTIVIDGSDNSLEIMIANANNSGFTEADIEILSETEYKVRVKNESKSDPPELSEIDRIGAELVLRELETLDLRSQNEALGGQIVGLELRLLTLEGGAANV
ncbi:hypothetical protein [Paenibacillus sp.]|uniref:hypothetical protein n=1 Tax=Paenibacillus sp. TaxID=58172 RepID=UPI0028AFC88D|nr:hypothetical protein [Paenibacillus sp.]